MELKVYELQVVTFKTLPEILKVSERTASTFIKNTRKCYNKPTGAITLGQVLKANNLEK